MKKSVKVPELKVFPTTNKSENSLQRLNPRVTLNQIVHTEVIQTTCKDADYQHRLYKGGQVNQESKSQPAHVAQRVELMHHTEPEDRGATAAGMNLHHQPPDSCCLHPAETRQSDMRGDFCCWDRGLNQCRTTDPENKDISG